MVTDPMAFQLAREQDGTATIRTLSASVFGTEPITAITYEINGDVFSDGIQFFDATTRLFSKTLATPIEPGAQFRITAVDATRPHDDGRGRPDAADRRRRARPGRRPRRHHRQLERHHSDARPPRAGQALRLRHRRLLELDAAGARTS